MSDCQLPKTQLWKKTGLRKISQLHKKLKAANFPPFENIGTQCLNVNCKITKQDHQICQSHNLKNKLRKIYIYRIYTHTTMNETQIAILMFLDTLEPKQAVSARYIARKISFSYNRVHTNLWKLKDLKQVNYAFRHTRNSYFWYKNKSDESNTHNAES